MTAHDDIKAELNALLAEENKIFDAASRDKNILDFSERYQAWYTRSLRIVDALAPDRAAEFRSYYQIDPKRKQNDYGSYVIQDYIKGIAARYDFFDKPLWDVHAAASFRFLNQIQILKSLHTRIDSVLSDVRGHLFSEIQDAELTAARDLAKISLRAAGALARVVLERHLQQMARDRGVLIKKKDPTIADLNDPLRAAAAYDVAAWRKIQYLADLGNLCSHQKTVDPTKEQVDELLSGVNWAVKSLA